jgi:hypothetical protein
VPHPDIGQAKTAAHWPGFSSLDGDDLEDDYIKGKALDTVRPGPASRETGEGGTG